jgi:hypothetical protein
MLFFVNWITKAKELNIRYLYIKYIYEERIETLQHIEF